jgi:hypothetical protein
MKKRIITLLLSLFALIVCKTSFAQTHPCNVLVLPTDTTTVVVGMTQTVTTQFFIQNVVSQNAKGTQIQVINSSSGQIYSDSCFHSTNAGVTATIIATMPTGTVYTYKIIRYTASNGQCQGGICDMQILPVEFGPFTISRSNQSVRLNWDTYTEVNNHGFAVEKNTAGSWAQIGFVPTQAFAGNSTQKIAYTYTDVNSEKGITQYRLKQVDIDNKFKYSEVRTVRGVNQAADQAIVYPNPSSNGAVRVILPTPTDVYDVVVSDMAGRVLLRKQKVIGNTEVNNLKPGIYILRIIGGIGEEVKKITIQ